MSAAGPTLPPHLLAKRKRQQEEDEENERATTSGAKRSKSPEDSEKRRRVMGPAMPPAPLDERPTESARAAEDSDSDDDDGFGPALPPENADGPAQDGDAEGDGANLLREPTPEAKPQRDAWMTMAPQQDDLAARMDPTRQRPRGFNTGKGAKGPAAAGGGDATAWHETAEQKQKRLADEMMGVASTTPAAASMGPQRPPASSNAADKDAATAKKVQQARGPSLVDQHKATKGKEAEDDDPSRRVFDREKDMGSGMRIGHKQREEMLRKAGGFSGKFAGGSYL